MVRGLILIVFLFCLQLRSFFYSGQCAAESELFQKVGFISVSYQVGGYPKGGYDFELTRKVSALVRGLPIRFVAIYVCYSASPWQRVADLISHLVEPLLRVRLRSVPGTLDMSCGLGGTVRGDTTDTLHYIPLSGSHQECLYKLMTLGIPHQCFPVNNEGESLLSNHLQWVEERRRIEDSGENDTMDLSQ